MSLDNVLFGDDLRVSGIVDFGDMTHAPLVCDLAVAIADVLHGHPDAVDAADAIIGGYVSVTPLDNDEAGLLADLVAARLATEVTVTAWRGGLYPDNTAYAAGGEPGARAFLDAIEAIGMDTVARRFRDACRRLPYRRASTSTLLERRRRGAATVAAVLLRTGSPGSRRGCLAVRSRRPPLPRLLQQRGRGRPQSSAGRAGGDAAAAVPRSLTTAAICTRRLSSSPNGSRPRCRRN